MTATASRRTPSLVSGRASELRRTRPKRLAKAVALADDLPELVSELRQRNVRIPQIEALPVAPTGQPLVRVA
jgi:hypothetical protein